MWSNLHLGFKSLLLRIKIRRPLWLAGFNFVIEGFNPLLGFSGSELSGFAHGRGKTSPDSEQIEQSMPLGIIVKLCERGANPRQAGAFLLGSDKVAENKTRNCRYTRATKTNPYYFDFKVR